MRILIAILALATLAPPAVAEGSSAGRIEVTGQGEVLAVPDMAVISIGVRHQHAEAAQAMAEVSAATAAVLEKLKAAGVEARDMQTSRLSLNPVWHRTGDNNEPPRVIGFEASNELNIRARDLGALGGLLDTVLQEGANSFSGLRFAMQDPAPHLAEARRAAVADARAKAELYAEAAGVALGRVLVISDAQIPSVRPMAREMAMMADAAPVPVVAGEVSTSAQVTVIYEISGQ